MSDKNYPWIPFFKELAQKVDGYEDHQEELIDILNRSGVNALWEPQKSGSPLKAIDPFTFYFSILKYKEINRIPIFRGLKKEFELQAEVPQSSTVPTPYMGKFHFFS